MCVLQIFVNVCTLPAICQQLFGSMLQNFIQMQQIPKAVDVAVVVAAAVAVAVAVVAAKAKAATKKSRRAINSNGGKHKISLDYKVVILFEVIRKKSLKLSLPVD